ncbi:hypothetical protein JCM8208_000056 [Rhodotorula glutinis]
MAAPAPPADTPSSTWPVGDDLRTSWQDLLLHTRLAALQAGLTRTAYTWDDDSRQFIISSTGATSAKGKGKGKDKDQRERVPRVDVEARDGGWPVGRDGDDMTRTWNARRRGEGSSSASGAAGAEREPGDDDYLAAEFVRQRYSLVHGAKLKFADLCVVEAKLHAASRRQGKYLEPAAVTEVEPNKARTRLRCALDPLSCTFSVVLEVQVGSCKARCVELQPEHSCTIELPPPQGPLLAMLDYFTPLKYVLDPQTRVVNPVTGLDANGKKPKRRQKKKKKVVEAEMAVPESEAAEPEEPNPLQRITRSQSARLAVLKKAAPPPDKGQKARAGGSKAKAKARSAARAEQWRKKHGVGAE